MNHRHAVHAYLDSLAKPVGSLGKLEELAAQLCQIQRSLRIKTTPRRLVVFAADHGVVEERVSLWPSSLTAQLVQLVAQGKAASSCLAKSTNTELKLIDVGMLGQVSRNEGVSYCQAIRRGTRNLAVEPAMTIDEFYEACKVGEAQASQAIQDGIAIVSGGEIGIGNTTVASCITAFLTGAPVHQVVGTGAGSTEDSLLRKTRVVELGIERAKRLSGHSMVERIASICGLEIAALAGFYRGAAAAGVPIVLDGFVTTAAALIAEELWPGIKKAMIAAHLSAEPGHQWALNRLELEPFFSDWNMRLGEGTGALLLMPIIDCAASMVNEMAKLDDIERILNVG